MASIQDVLRDLREIDFGELSLDNIGSWPLAVKVIVWALAFVACLALGYVYNISDLRQELARAEHDLVELHAVLADLYAHGVRAAVLERDGGGLAQPVRAVLPAPVVQARRAAVGRQETAVAPAYAVRGPIDIVGAGDAATSGIVASLLAGADELAAAAVGNLVASITVQQIGQTGTATPELVGERWREVDTHSRRRRRRSD